MRPSSASARICANNHSACASSCNDGSSSSFRSATDAANASRLSSASKACGVPLPLTGRSPTTAAPCRKSSTASGSTCPAARS
eukprot:6286023-Alexandrium_andersonii.AAC.1